MRGTLDGVKKEIPIPQNRQALAYPSECVARETTEAKGRKAECGSAEQTGLISFRLHAPHVIHLHSLRAGTRPRIACERYSPGEASSLFAVEHGSLPISWYSKGIALYLFRYTEWASSNANTLASRGWLRMTRW